MQLLCSGGWALGTHLSLSSDGAAAEGVGVADALKAAHALRLLGLLNDCSLHNPQSPYLLCICAQGGQLGKTARFNMAPASGRDTARAPLLGLWQLSR